jgi:two-component system NarL family response regulator
MGINVLVADQERAFADALTTRLAIESEIDVLGMVQLRMPRPRLFAPASADVVLLDGDVPGQVADRLCEELSGPNPRTHIVMLSSSSEPVRIVQAIRAGVAAWVRKDESLDHLLHVISGVARGETWLPPAETGNVVRLLLQEQDRQRQAGRLLATLTPREREVLACLVEGTARRDLIAERLRLSVNTVRTHLQNLMAKLGVHSALEAVALTRDYVGWLTEDGSSRRQTQV